VDFHVGRLASQTAAHKLMQIMGMLVIPIVVLLALILLKAKNEIDVLAQERAGVALAQWVVNAPIKISTEETAIFKKLELKAGVFTSDNPLVQQWQQPLTMAQRDALKRDYLAELGNASGVLRDGSTDVHALASVAFDLAPNYVQKYNALATSSTVDSQFDGANAAQISLFLMAAGDVQSVLRRLKNTLRAGTKLKPDDAQNALKAFQNADVALGGVTQTISDAQMSGAAKQLQFDNMQKVARFLSQTGVLELQNKVLSLIEQRLSKRNAALWRNLGLLMLAGVACAITGIGLAILLVRSTLLRLDEVEVARQDAIAARKDAEQVALRFTSINTDISKLNQELALKVNELRAVQEELVKKGRMEQLGQLIATIAHEVRNPLGAIRTTAFMIERKISGRGLGLEGHLQRINNSVNRCDTIISQLLDFSRTKQINSAPIMLDDWLAKMVREEASRFPTNILIECALGLDSQSVNFDPTRMQRAVVNILNNASEALLGQQDPTVTGSQLHHHIWVSTKRVGDFAVIRIADNGPGISAEYIEKIREPLFTTKSFGTGLGIPAVEQVVNQHGGKLDISSEVGRGAVFTIYLPLPQPGAKAA
jgi:signal transduction histidine kinase